MFLGASGGYGVIGQVLVTAQIPRSHTPANERGLRFRAGYKV